MDTPELERLSALTRALVSSTASPLIKLFYWRVFLDLYFQSGIRSPVYIEDALPEMTALLDRAKVDLVDLEFLAELRRLSESPLLPDTELALRFRRTVSAVQIPREASFASAEPELHAWILLVPAARELLGHKPELSVPAMLSVRASRGIGLRKAGEVVWRIEREDRDPIESIASQALCAGQREARVKRHTLAYEVRLQRPDWHLRGASLGLALAVLFFMFETAEKRRSPRILAPDVVVLGSVDEEGRAVPVSEASLPSKIRAACGAGFRAIVLPTGNFESARREILRLSERFPQLRAPSLVSVGSLSEVLADRNLFVRPARPVRELVARVRTTRVLVGIAIVLVALGAMFWFRPRTPLPENTRIAPNEREPLLVTARLSGFPPREWHWRFDTAVGTAAIVDLAPNARAALLVGTNPDGPHPAHVYCYDLASRRLLWTRDLSDPLALPELTRSSVTMQIPEVATADIDNDGRKDVIAIVQANPMSPCFIYWLRNDGSIHSVYAHRGYLFKIHPADFELDGRIEIFLAGTSNTDDHPLNQSATLVVLDCNDFTAWPEGGPFRGSTRAAFDSCRARVIFPPIPEHCRILGTPGYYVKSYVVHSSKTDPFVTVSVGWGSDPGLVVTLNREFQPVRVVAEDNLRPIVQKAMKSGVIQEDFTTPARLEEYRRLVKRVH